MGQGKPRSKNDQEVGVEGRERSFSIVRATFASSKVGRTVWGNNPEQSINEMEDAGARGTSRDGFQNGRRLPMPSTQD